MKPETILRAYRKTWIPVRNGWQGPIRARRARQRARFEAWLYRWADRGLPRERQAERKPRLGSVPPLTGAGDYGGEEGH